MRMEMIHPDDWAPAKGYSNGVLVDGSARMLFVAGQVAWDADQEIVGANSFHEQFAQALRNVVAVVLAAGGEPAHLVRVTIYVIDKEQYVAELREVGAAWRDIVGRHFPAMSLVEVAGLLEEGALLEIEATAALP